VARGACPLQGADVLFVEANGGRMQSRHTVTIHHDGLKWNRRACGPATPQRRLTTTKAILANQMAVCPVPCSASRDLSILRTSNTTQAGGHRGRTQCHLLPLKQVKSGL